ncbi:MULTISPECIES: carbohydrate ABC transporter permease [unclassified Actinotalea]|uniref:carbohydrate ABC transporter permease n=1 Tax=unclassified Actinotalea TaxID=2638618 RepID=UPI0015F58CDE|nr:MULTISPECIES: sugar ABC transporter permease [unclassified Actinotalea]
MSAPAQAVRERGRTALPHAGPSLWLLAPAALLFVTFAVVPLLGAIGLSLTSWNGLGVPAWTGFDNWRDVYSDPVTWHTIRLSLLVMVGSWVVQTPLSLLLGVYLAGGRRSRAVVGVAYFLPLLLSSAAVGLTWKNLLDPNFGLTSTAPAGPLSHAWLGDPRTALAAVVVIVAWHFVPLHTLLYQAGVRQIPRSLYEAAAMDGASTLQQFRSITLPQLKYTIVTSSVLVLVGSLTYFDLVFVLTGGGPGDATRILPLHMYLTGFQATEMGKASAIAAVLAVIGLLLSLALTRFSGFSRMQSQQEGL